MRYTVRKTKYLLSLSLSLSLSLVFGPQASESGSLELNMFNASRHKKHRRSPVFRQSSRRCSATYKFKETRLRGGGQPVSMTRNI